MPAIAPIDLMAGLAAVETRLAARPHRLEDVESLTELDRDRLEADWEVWLRTLFRRYVSRKDTDEPIPFAERHRELWNWAWSVKLGVRSRPFVAIWPRGGGKSTTAELAAVAMGARRSRRYCLYVSGIQDKADDHVGNMGSMLESAAFGRVYPLMASRLLSKFGNSKGWRRNRLRTAAGYTVDALGLDTAARGIKLEDVRPDLIIVDDIDDGSDSPKTTAKKTRDLTTKILPAGSNDLVVLFVQNLIHPDSIASRLVDGRADFLQDRIVSGPYVALEGAAYETREFEGRRIWVVVAGTPTWEGQDLEACEGLINTIGLAAFKAESQQEVAAPPGGLYDDIEFRHIREEDLPDLDEVVVAVDPAVSDTDESDCHGVNVDGIRWGPGDEYTVYRLFSWEERASPREAIGLALLKAAEFRGSKVVVETDQGGDTWKDTYEGAWRDLLGDPDTKEILEFHGRRRPPTMVSRKAGGEGPKVHRQNQQLADYQLGRIVHVIRRVGSTHAIIEAALKRFPKTKPLDLADASFWSWRELTHSRTRRRRARAPVALPKVSIWRRPL
ncbi:MAG: hypothetical protein ACM3US_09875 [Sphingomonadaceae bacterium]